MISYVLLIAIAIGISTGVFVWLKSFANVTPVVDCEEGTSVLMENYECKCQGEPYAACWISLTIKNNGRFNVSGIILTISNDSKKEPYIYLINKEDPQGYFPGYNFFSPQLNPGSSIQAYFLNKTKDNKNIDTIASIKIQPIIIIKKNRVVCQNSVIKQPIDCSFP